MKNRPDERKWRRTILASALVALVGLGCQPQQQPPANESAPTTGGVASTEPITMTWNQTSNCVSFSKPTIRIKVGDRVRFNSSLSRTVTLTISAGAFGPNDTTMVIQAQGSYLTGPAVTPNSYQMTSDPGMCPGLGGGVGPVVIIEETK